MPKCSGRHHLLKVNSLYSSTEPTVRGAIMDETGQPIKAQTNKQTKHTKQTHTRSANLKLLGIKWNHTEAQTGLFMAAAPPATNRAPCLIVCQPPSGSADRLRAAPLRGSDTRHQCEGRGKPKLEADTHHELLTILLHMFVCGHRYGHCLLFCVIIKRLSQRVVTGV